MSEENTIVNCPQCGGALEQTSYGPMCPKCLRRAVRDVKKEAEIELCRGCGRELREPVIIVDGYGPCCRLAPAPLTQAAPNPTTIIPSVPMPGQAFLIGVEALVIDAETVATLDTQKINALKVSVKRAGQGVPIIVDAVDKCRVKCGAGLAMAIRDLATEHPQFVNVWAVASPNDELDGMAAEFVAHEQSEAIKRTAGSDLPLDLFAAQIADLLGIDFKTAFESLDMTELAPISVALQGFNAAEMDVSMPKSLTTRGTHVSAVGRVADRFFAVAPSPEPKRGPSRIVVNVTGEIADAVMQAIDAMKIQHDQTTASDGDLLAIVCREWLAGRGRDVPKERPTPDF